MTSIAPEQEKKRTMPTYVVECEMPGAGTLSAAQLRAAAHHSVSILNEMDTCIQWIQSFVTADRIIAVYIAPDEKTVLEHILQIGLTANRVLEIATIIYPTTATE